MRAAFLVTPGVLPVFRGVQVSLVQRNGPQALFPCTSLLENGARRPFGGRHEHKKPITSGSACTSQTCTPARQGRCGSFWRRCGLLARLRVRFAAILFPPTCQSTAGGTFYPKNVTRRVLRARCDMPERLFDGDEDASVGGEGEGAGVVDLTNQVVGARGIR